MSARRRRPARRPTRTASSPCAAAHDAARRAPGRHWRPPGEQVDLAGELAAGEQKTCES
jgi:hypothetical protein